MLSVCDILEHLKEMIGQSAINRRSQSFIPNSLRAYRGKTTRSELTGGRRARPDKPGRLFLFESSCVQMEGRAFTIITVFARAVTSELWLSSWLHVAHRAKKYLILISDNEKTDFIVIKDVTAQLVGLKKQKNNCKSHIMKTVCHFQK